MIDKKYLPSKKFVIALSIALFFIIIAIILNYWKPNNTKFNNQIDNEKLTKALTELDTDKDGLPDWKEALYGTDPKNPDTDSDEANDYEEIISNRDPLKANTSPKGQEPNDKIDEAIIEENEKMIEEYEKLSDLAKFSRTLISNITAAQPINGTMSEEMINTIVNSAINDIGQKEFVAKTSIEDLKLLPTNEDNRTSIFLEYREKYLSETDKLLILIGADLNLIEKYREKGDIESKEALLKFANDLEKIANNYISIPVPVAIGYYDVYLHLMLINNIEKIVAIDREIANVNYKDMSFLSNFSQHAFSYQELLSVLKVIDAILKIQRNII
jgi:hypothetical protein